MRRHVKVYQDHSDQIMECAEAHGLFEAAQAQDCNSSYHERSAVINSKYQHSRLRHFLYCTACLVLEVI